MFKTKPQEDRDSPQGASPGGKKNFLRRRWPVLVIVCAAVVGIGVWVVQMRASDTSAQSTYIEVTPARRSITNIYSEDGTIEAAESHHRLPGCAHVRHLPAQWPGCGRHGQRRAGRDQIGRAHV